MRTGACSYSKDMVKFQDWMKHRASIAQEFANIISQNKDLLLEREKMAALQEQKQMEEDRKNEGGVLGRPHILSLSFKMCLR